MKRLIAVLLTICIAAGLPVAAFAENGPSSGEWSSAWIQLIQGEEAQLLFSSSEPAVEVAGAAYERETNTITLTNYNHPNTSLNTNEMGDDLKLKLVGGKPYFRSCCVGIRMGWKLGNHRGRFADYQ